MVERIPLAVTDYLYNLCSKADLFIDTIPIVAQLKETYIDQSMKDSLHAFICDKCQESVSEKFNTCRKCRLVEIKSDRQFNSYLTALDNVKNECNVVWEGSESSHKSADVLLGAWHETISFETDLQSSETKRALDGVKKTYCDVFKEYDGKRIDQYVLLKAFNDWVEERKEW